jgi:UrcA family protein
MYTVSPSDGLRRFIAIAILGALASSPLCGAAERIDAPNVKVNYADLNLSTSEGAAVLYQRIRWAAKHACRPSFETSTDSVSESNEEACIHHAIASAVTQIDRPQLFAIYKANGKTPVVAALASQSR